MPKTNRILIIVTNVGEYEKVGYRTGLWLGELTHFWDVAEEAGFRMDIASPKGGYVPIDPESLMLPEAGHALGLDGKVHRHYEDRAFMDQLVDTMKVADADAEAYDAIYMTGGHGVCFDFRSADLAGGPGRGSRMVRPSAETGAQRVGAYTTKISVRRTRPTRFYGPG